MQDNKTTAHTEFFNGIPITIPNKIIQGKGFYISYNNHDVGIYGSDTTALVDENGLHFYILNGDHRKEYNELIPQGFHACLEYFKHNPNKINKYSEK